MKIFLIDGPNMNMLGIREPNIYGLVSYKDNINNLKLEAKKLNVKLYTFQSNMEGKIIDLIQKAYFKKIDGIIINPASLTTTSIGILDALKATNIPTIEVHISNTYKRETFRKNSLLKNIVIDRIVGQGTNGYLFALKKLINFLENKNGK